MRVSRVPVKIHCMLLPDLGQNMCVCCPQPLGFVCNYYPHPQVLQVSAVRHVDLETIGAVAVEQALVLCV